jgi:hypothetical protein
MTSNFGQNANNIYFLRHETSKSTKNQHFTILSPVVTELAIGSGTFQKQPVSRNTPQNIDQQHSTILSPLVTELAGANGVPSKKLDLERKKAQKTLETSTL